MCKINIRAGNWKDYKSGIKPTPKEKKEEVIKISEGFKPLEAYLLKNNFHPVDNDKARFFAQHNKVFINLDKMIYIKFELDVGKGSRYYRYYIGQIAFVGYMLNQANWDNNFSEITELIEKFPGGQGVPFLI